MLSQLATQTVGNSLLFTERDLAGNPAEGSSDLNRYEFGKIAVSVVSTQQ
jgi:hypothetical protein